MQFVSLTAARTSLLDWPPNSLCYRLVLALAGAKELQLPHGMDDFDAQRMASGSPRRLQGSPTTSTST